MIEKVRLVDGIVEVGDFCVICGKKCPEGERFLGRGALRLCKDHKDAIPKQPWQEPKRDRVIPFCSHDGLRMEAIGTAQFGLTIFGCPKDFRHPRITSLSEGI